MEVDLTLSGLGRDDVQMDISDFSPEELNAIIPSGLNAIGLHAPWPARPILTAAVVKSTTDDATFCLAVEQAFTEFLRAQVAGPGVQMFGDRRIVEVHHANLSVREALRAFEKWQGED